MTFNYQAAAFWLAVLSVVVSALNSVYLWWSNHNKAQTAAVKAVDKRVDAMDKRINGSVAKLALLESDMKHLPQRTDLKAIYEKLDSLNGFYHDLNGGITQLKRTIDLIHQSLLNQSINTRSNE